MCDMWLLLLYIQALENWGQIQLDDVILQAYELPL